jgi:hypothetical protein
MDPARVSQDAATELVRTVTRWYEVNHPKSPAAPAKLFSHMGLQCSSWRERILPRRSR